MMGYVKAYKIGNMSVVPLLAGIILLGSAYYYFSKGSGGEVATPQMANSVRAPNKIIAVYKADLTVLEKDQVMRSVDAFMNAYKLPHGDFQNTYTLLVERRLNDVMLVITDPEQPKNDTHATLYLRKANDIWSVDPSGGPWCTLEEFERNDCE
jgi:hypothetical protein